MSLLQGLIIVVGLVVLAALWLWWQTAVRAHRPLPRHSRPLGVDTQAYQDTTPLADGPGQVPPADAAETDYGPETIVSYMDVPTNTRLPSEFATSNLSSLFPEDIEPDTGPSTLPPAPTQDGNDLIRIRQALRDLDTGALDRAWEVLRGFVPEPGQRDIALETMDRVAQ